MTRKRTASVRHRAVPDTELETLVREYAVWRDMPARYAEAIRELRELEAVLDQPPLHWPDLGDWARGLLRAELCTMAIAGGTNVVPLEYQTAPIDTLRVAVASATARPRGAPVKSARKIAAMSLRQLFERLAGRGESIRFSATANEDYELGESEAVRCLRRVAALAGDDRAEGVDGDKDGDHFVVDAAGSGERTVHRGEERAEDSNEEELLEDDLALAEGIPRFAQDG